MANSPVPQNDSSLLPWLQNFNFKLPSHASALGLAPADVTQTQTDCQALVYLIQTFIPLLKQDL